MPLPPAAEQRASLYTVGVGILLGGVCTAVPWLGNLRTRHLARVEARDPASNRDLISPT